MLSRQPLASLGRYVPHQPLSPPSRGRLPCGRLPLLLSGHPSLGLGPTLILCNPMSANYVCKDASSKYSPILRVLGGHELAADVHYSTQGTNRNSKWQQ